MAMPKFFGALALSLFPATAATKTSDGAISVASLGGADRQSPQGPRKYVVDRNLEEDPMGGSYEHMGCFADLREDRVLGKLYIDEDMTPMLCHIHCDAIGSAYMALQYSNECWCSHDGALDYARHGVGICDMPCAGDDAETCGGDHMFDLYQLEWAARPSEDEYLNCFKDFPNDRIMGEMIVQDNMTTAVCREHCVGKESRYYGTQFGNECWCGTSASFWDYNRHGWGVCHMECAGDASVACGGYNAFSLFRFLVTGDDFTPSPIVDTATTMSSTVPDHNPSPPSPVSEEDDDTGGSLVDFMDLLSIHNVARCMHNASPLVWDSDMAATAETYADILTTDDNCGSTFQVADSGYGENLYTCGYPEGDGCYNAEAAMQELYNDELTDTVQNYGDHATAILWKETERIGCAVGKCFDDEDHVETLVCIFDPPGNDLADLENQVEPPSRTSEECSP